MPETTSPNQDPRRASPANKPSLPTDVDPWAIVNDPQLDHRQKVERLHQLEHDVRLVEVALEEGMFGSTRLPALSEVLAALEQVSIDHDGDAKTTPSKI